MTAQGLSRSIDQPRSTAAKADADILLRADNVTVVYDSSRGRVKALESLSLSLRRGEFLSVLGPSGCGKSTLLKLVAGLLAPSRGTLHLEGRQIDGPRPDVGVVFQQATLVPWLTVRGNVLLPIKVLKKDLATYGKIADELLSLVGLGGFRNHYPHELSGGMQQRVAIARGLIHDPKLILMDEPFAALDAMTREHMMLELQRIWMSAERSIVFITHSIPEAVFLSDKIVVLSTRPGKVIHEISIDLPRPRSMATLASPEFAGLCNELRALFM